MPDANGKPYEYGIEVTADGLAAMIAATSTSSSIEVSLDSVSLVGLIPEAASVEVIQPGPVINTGGTGGGTIAYRVAASNASQKAKDSADFVCDGVDDQVEINAALEAAAPNAALVGLSEGDFSISAKIAIARDCGGLVGSGTPNSTDATQTGVGTRLNAVAGLTGAVIWVQRILNDRPVYAVYLHHFTIDGHLVGAAVDGVLYRSNRGHVNGIHIIRCTGSGLRVRGYQTPTDTVNWNTYDTIISHVQSSYNLEAGVYADLGSADGHMEHCILFNNRDNFIVAGSSWQITSSHFYDATNNNIWFNGGGSRTKFVNCKVEGAGQHGLFIDSTNGGYSDIQVTGCGFSTNGDSAHNTYDHIYIGGPNSKGIGRTVIIGNSFGHKASQTANQARYGVNMSSSTAQSTVILANSFGPSLDFPAGGTSQFGTGPINYAGSTALPATVKGNANAADWPAPGGSTGGGGTVSTAGTSVTLTTPASSWTQAHSLGRIPSCELYLNGAEVEADITVSTTSISISTPAQVTGTFVLVVT